jgi:hypothetical protein
VQLNITLFLFRSLGSDSSGLLSLTAESRFSVIRIDEFFFRIDCFFFSLMGVPLLSLSSDSPPFDAREALDALSLSPNFYFISSVITKFESPNMLCELASLSESL